MTDSRTAALSSLDYHVLLAMAEGPQYGYAIKSAVEEESAGTLSPRAASLYRVIGRLMGRGFVEELAVAPVETPHPGRARKYYRLTEDGRVALSDEARRLHAAAALADERLRRAETGP
jgi:DNA-binding PadR family transcriptional regulator